MSLYNMVFGESSVADKAMALVGLTRAEVGRYRDAWVEDRDGNLRVAVYTRNGGGNRQCWNESDGDCGCTGCFMTYRVHKLPHYSHDRDDEFDSTYATIFFDVPEAAQEAASLMAEGVRDTDERWLTMLDNLKVSQ